MWLLSVVLTNGCQKPTQRVSLSDSPFSPEARRPYLLCPGDQLQLRFPTDPALDQVVRIRADGMISVPHLGDVQAAQREPMQIASEVQEKLVGVLQKPEVTVIVVSEEGRRVYLSGEVQNPGAISLTYNQTLLRALSAAGGLRETAHSAGVLILRCRPGEATYVLQVNRDRILGGLDPDVVLEPFDIVYVPESTIAKVDRFVEQYINRIIPRPMSFPFITELATQPVRVVGQNQQIPPVTITR